MMRQKLTQSKKPMYTEPDVHHRPWFLPPFLVWKCCAGRRGSQLQCQMPSENRPLSGTLRTYPEPPLPLRPLLRPLSIVIELDVVGIHGSISPETRPVALQIVKQLAYL